MSIPNSLVPHAVCWASDPQLIWVMVITNLITFLSYLSIAATLLFLVRKTRRILVRDWGYFVVGFALFILACGSTHLLEVITTWTPIFWVDAWTNIVTSVLSAVVALMLIRRITTIAFGINDYADRLANTEMEKLHIEDSLVAAQKLEDWSRMSAAVSHEIKNPLQAIQNLQFLICASEGVSPEITELAKMAGEEAQRVLTIADSSLSFIRQTAAPELIDLEAAVRSVEVLMGRVIREKGIEFEVVCSGDCHVEGYAGEIRQVLLNLIRNACEAVTRTGTKLRVNLTGKDNRVEASVIDQGSGIASELIPNIFDFGVTTKGSLGNGIGLWTVKRIVHKHRGEVKIHSKVGEGTRVDVWWPRSFTLSDESAVA